MKKYKYARLNIFSGIHIKSLGLSGTDPKLIEEVSLELKKMAPQAKMDTGRNSVHMENIKNQHEVYWWLIIYLCDQGWEPFSAENHVESRENHFRFEYEE